VTGWPDLPLLVGGEAVSGAGERFPVVDPATEEVRAEVAGADAGQLDAAVAAARWAAKAWRAADSGERAEAIRRLADAIDKHRDDLAEAIVTEVGSPVTLARGLQVGIPPVHLRWYADQSTVDRTADLGPHSDPVASRSVVAYRPIGVVAAITAYNYPLLLATHKMGAALAAGCTVVLMPSPRTPVATLLLARLVAETLPPGVVNVVVGGADVARRLTEHPGVDAVSFTGSAEVGAAVMRQAASGVRRTVLELGGKSAAILFPDADLATVLPELHRRYARNAGQGCASPTRLLVPRERWDEFVDASRAIYPDIPVGDPWAEETIVGPVISAAHRERVEGYVSGALADGGALLAGGGRPERERGWFVNPALLTGVAPESRIAQEEIFGPVAVAFPYSTVDDAVGLANATPFGLHAYLYTGDHERAMAVAGELRAGTVSVNGGGGFRPDAPMGGVGVSGVGRELGEWGIHEFLEPQHVQWREHP